MGWDGACVVGLACVADGVQVRIQDLVKGAPASETICGQRLFFS